MGLVTHPSAEATALLWVERSAPVLRGLTHRFGNGLHALSLVSDGQDEGLDAEDVALLRNELLGFERLTEQYRALVLALEEEPSAGRLEDALTVALGLRAAHVAVRDSALVPELDANAPALLVPPTALAQALLILVLGDTADGDERPEVRVEGSEDGVRVELRGAHLNGPDEDGAAAVAWLLRKVRPAPQLSWLQEEGTTVARLSLPSLRASRRASASA
jgi:hypothetical protein